MDFNAMFGFITGIVTLAAIVLAIYQTYQAKMSDKKLEETRSALTQLEKNIATSDLKLIKAVEYYNNGHFDDSLKAFRGYIKDSDDITELNSAINRIFWKESRKIYEKYIGLSGTSPSMLTVIIIQKQNEVEEKYPEFLVKLLEAASTKEGNSLGYFKVPVFLNLKKYQSVIENISGISGASISKKSSEAFREYIKLHCEYELAKTKEDA